MRLAKEKEELTRERSSLTVQITSGERENRVLAENIASLKSDKESLETALYETQQTMAKLESRKEALEAENQEITMAKEALTVDLCRVKKEQEIEQTKMRREQEMVEQKLGTTLNEHGVQLKKVRNAFEVRLLIEDFTNFCFQGYTDSFISEYGRNLIQCNLLISFKFSRRRIVLRRKELK